MKASEAKLLDLLKKSPQFIVPIYQRTYSWGERQCRQLWDDIVRTGTNEDIDAHFLGSIVYIEKGLYHVTSQSPLLVIDGQQRLTTVSLLLEALARHIGDTEPVDGFSAKKIRSYYLLNPLEKGDLAYKILLSQTDRDTLCALLRQKNLPAEHSIRVAENFTFFYNQVEMLRGDFTPLCKGLAKLVIVDIALSRNQDNPQLIFESMNSTGLELTQADLIRNFILMGLEPEHQNRLYSDYWRPIEQAFGQEAYGSEFDAFMRHYLTIKTGEIPKIREVYDAFKAYARKPNVAKAGVDALVADIHRFAGYYCAMALGKEQDKKLGAAFRDLCELNMDVAWPFLLELYDDYRQGILPPGDFLRAVRLVESYIFRRAVCSIPTNSLNKTFATFCRALDKERYLESIEAHFMLLPSYRRFPRNTEFERELKVRDLYNFRSRSYWLRRLENHNHKELVPVGEYTIEHILPQNENLSKEWREALGPDWKRIQETWLHTLGNLTLTGYNSEYSDRPFPEKRDMPGGFRESPLHLNQKLGQVDVWNEDAIQARADRLAKIALEVWPEPVLSDEVLEQYRSKSDTHAAYRIEDHPYLLSGPTAELFQAFRMEVLALDPCVTEEFLKHYVAYKAETNFVDVVPQKSRLQLSLNLKFHQVHDPRGLCKDVTNIGRWGNGDVEVMLSRAEDLPYVMGLVRQAFETQISNEESEA